MRLAIITTFALLLAAMTPALAQQYTGTWSIERAYSSRSGATPPPDSLYLQLEYRVTTPTGNEQWSESRSVPIGDFRGITMDVLNARGPRSFDIVRDAGTMHADGMFSDGHGAGTWTFVPSPSFGGQLQRRGIGAPNAEQQFQLAMAGFKFSTLDMLLADGFQRPSIADLVSMAQHGVSDDYIRSMRGLGLHPKSVQSLIRMRDHGVGPTFAAAILRAMPTATIDDLISLRDHGVSEQFMTTLRQLGYNSSPTEAASMRDHGVSELYIQDLAKMGYHPSASDLIRLRDHGVSASFIERMRSHGYTKLSVDELIRLRDSGF
ncbi:MAG TPA: hypothetical protein VFO29_04410 [Candidatus Rubrimentiphilum sp.]|nr:hypothetical protein [Candidatus Rubrimentiphilum sp.]